MNTMTRDPAAVVREVFPYWSVAIPPSFSETFVEATDGRQLLATITCDDRPWTRRTWLSIRLTTPSYR